MSVSLLIFSRAASVSLSAFLAVIGYSSHFLETIAPSSTFRVHMHALCPQVQMSEPGIGTPRLETVQEMLLYIVRLVGVKLRLPEGEHTRA